MSLFIKYKLGKTPLLLTETLYTGDKFQRSIREVFLYSWRFFLKYIESYRGYLLFWGEYQMYFIECAEITDIFNSILFYPIPWKVVGAPQMNSQHSLSILTCFRLPNLSWQSPFLSTLWYCLRTSSSVCLFFFFVSLCPVGLSLLYQKTLRHGQTILASVSWPGSGVRHILQWLLGSFCEPPHW